MGEKKVYILFTDTGTMFTRLIKLYTKESYNHVSISFDDQLKETFSFGRKKPYNPFIGGFIREIITEGLFEKANCKLYSYTVSEVEHEQMRSKVRQIEKEKERYKYNLLGLFAILLNLNFTRSNAFFCSQFVATILSENQDILDKSPSLITPRDLIKIKLLKLVYQGKLSLFADQSKGKTMDNYLEFSFE